MTLILPFSAAPLPARLPAEIIERLIVAIPSTAAISQAATASGLIF
jgi:hypothetical protein